MIMDQANGVGGLINQPDDDATTRLAEALLNLRRRDLDLRRSAVGVLLELRAVPELIETMHTNEHWFIRMAAAQALGQLGDARAMPHLEQVLYNTHDKWFAFDAAVALTQIGTPEALDALHVFRESLRRES